MASKLMSFLDSQSYKADFKNFMQRMENKYGSAILEECGIGSQLDISKMSKDFFKTKTTADVSVDANANVADTSVISHKIEMAKPFQLINSYYRMFKELKKNRSVEYAEKILESQISGRIYINDFHAASSGMAYSYYGKTSIIIKENNTQPFFSTMEELYDKAEALDLVKDEGHMLVADLSSLSLTILDEQGEFVPLLKVMKHKAHCPLLKMETKDGCCTVITTDHPVILEDWSEKEGGNVQIGDKLKRERDITSIFQSSTDDSFNNRAYIIGFILGDGYILKKGCTASIRQKNIQSKKIFESLNKEFSNVWGRTKNGVDEVFFGNKEFVNSAYMSIGRGCDNKVLPKNVFSWSKGELKSLIGGLLDSDGCINKVSGVIDIRVTSFALVQQIAEIAKFLGYKRVRTSFIGANGNTGYIGTKDLFRVSFVCNDKSMVDFSEKIKKNNIIVFRDRKKDGRFETNEVHKITEFQQEYVYDITTESGHFYSQGLIQHNCFNYSTFDTALMGIPGKFDGRGGSKPPKNLMSFLGQIELFSLIAGNSTLGATGLADLLIVMSIYAKKILATGEDAHFKLEGEDNCWQYIESLLTGFIYRLNQPYRGSQSLFSNVSVFDKYFLEGLLPSYSLELEGEVYSAEMEVVQKMQDIYIDIMNRELARKPITFPVTTACFSIDEDKNILDKDFLTYISEKNLKFGFINMYSGKSSTLSSCCRLRSEQDNEYFNSFGSGSTKIGSLSVSTGNLPQLAFKLRDEENAKELFLEKVKELVIDCQEANNAKRNLIKKAIKAGAQPLYSLGYMDIKRQYSTFGVVGLYEALQILGMDIKTEEGKEYALRMLDIINETNKELQARFKAPHNCEQIPAENVAVKLAKKDRILGYNNIYALYSNQFIPLIERTNMFDRIELQGTFDNKFSGGAICHLNMDQEIKDASIMANLIETCAKRGVVYFAINYVLQECEEGHMSVGNVTTCPICGKPITGKYTRVVGFLTKVNNWNATRREADFPNRQFYGSINI